MKFTNFTVSQNLKRTINNHTYKMKIIQFLVAIFCLLLISCSTQKKITTQELPHLQTTINKANEFDSKSSFIDEDIRGTSVDALGNIHFADSILEKRLKVILRLDSTEFINLILADTIKNLNLIGKSNALNSEKIKSIDGLQYFENLERLILSFNLINDLLPLQNLSKLEFILAQNNDIKDISPLKNLQKLERLILYKNDVEDISTLSKLKKLTEVCLWDNEVKDIRALATLENLIDLNIGKNLVQDISPLQNCKKLKSIWLYGNPITNPEILSVFSETLETLSIARCNIDNIEYLENCQNLKTLLIFNNNITDISVLRKMHHLNVLLASNNKIENIDVLQTLINEGAFQVKSRMGRSNTNIDLSMNKIEYQTEKNKKIKMIIEKNVEGVKL